jgi:ferric-dicitrate binding protein FerR (iron transport regulator)
MSDEPRPERTTDLVEALIRAGGRRVEPPEEAYRAVLAAAEVALREKLNRRRWLRVGAWVAAAAAAAGIVALGLDLLPWRTAPSPVAVARIERYTGTVEWREAGSGPWTVLTPTVAALARGGTLRTLDDSGVGLLYPDQSSLRLAPGSEIELTDAWFVTLRRGTLYVGTAANAAGRLEVVTPRGRVRHLGTQFELRYQAPELRLRVREGRVSVAATTGGVVAEAGEELTLTQAGTIERRPFARDDLAWHWAELLAPAPQLEGRSAQALLEWAARETGRELVYANPAVARRAATVVLHGEPGPLAPAATLDVMLATTDLTVDMAEDGRIRVHTR